MSIQPSEYVPSKLGFSEPQKAEGTHDYTTIKFTYNGRKLDFFLPGKTDAPGVKASQIKENPKKPGSLTQGIFIEDDEDLLKMAMDIEEQAFNTVIKNKEHKAMPANLAKFKDVQQLKELFPSIKGIVHYPKKKDAQGKTTGVNDPSAKPMIYYGLMRANLAGPKKGEIFTKYISAQILDPDIEAAVKRGERKESDFLFPVITNPKTKQRGLYESKTGMRIIPTVMVGDIYIAADKIKIRLTLSDAYVVGFISGEPESRSKAKAAMAASGIRMSEPLQMPNAPEEEDETDEANVVTNKVGPAETAKRGYSIEVIGE